MYSKENRSIFKTKKNNIKDLCYDLVSFVLLVPTVALHSLLQALLIVLRDPVANLGLGKDHFFRSTMQAS